MGDEEPNGDSDQTSQVGFLLKLANADDHVSPEVRPSGKDQGAWVELENFCPSGGSSFLGLGWGGPNNCKPSPGSSM